MIPISELLVVSIKSDNDIATKTESFQERLGRKSKSGCCSESRSRCTRWICWAGRCVWIGAEYGSKWRSWLLTWNVTWVKSGSWSRMIPIPGLTGTNNVYLLMNYCIIYAWKCFVIRGVVCRILCETPILDSIQGGLPATGNVDICRKELVSCSNEYWSYTTIICIGKRRRENGRSSMLSTRGWCLWPSCAHWSRMGGQIRTNGCLTYIVYICPRGCWHTCVRPWTIWCVDLPLVGTMPAQWCGMFIFTILTLLNNSEY